MTDRRIRLVQSAKHFHGPGQQNSPTCRYVTLSHRWGQSNMVKLLHSNIVKLQHCIPFEVLPVTFQHAVIITRQLHIRYLWIDALCIIQDSHVDWVKEGVAMADIYKNTYCTIAAASATDSDSGLFFPRHPSHVATSSVRPIWRAARQRELILTRSIESIIEELDESPLQTRGWVLQERLLSPRTVHFTKAQVFFECHTILASEVFPDGIPDLHGQCCSVHPGHFSVHPVVESLEQARRGESKEIIEWNKVIERYTKCQLTYETDKLAALCGIATHFSREKLPQDEYLAGIWASQLPFALLWRLMPDQKVMKEKGEFRAPSWSWASVDGRINTYLTENSGSHLNGELAEVLMAKVSTLSENTSGLATTGFLWLRGLTAKAHITGQDNIRGLHYIRGVSRSTKNGKYPSIFLVPRIDTDGPRAMFGRITYDLPADHHSGLGQEIPIVLIRFQSREGGGSFKDHVLAGFMVHGLALREVGDGLYERVGIFTFFGESLIAKLLDFLDYPNGRPITLI